MTEKEYTTRDGLTKKQLPYHEILAPGFTVYSGGGYSREMALDSVPDGWRPLVNEMFDFLEGIENPPPVVQVKRKYGELRIYLDLSNVDRPGKDGVLAKTKDLAERSRTICAICGEPGKPRETFPGYWLTTCDEHAPKDSKVTEVRG